MMTQEWSLDQIEIRDHLDAIHAPEILYDPVWWETIEAWMASEPNVFYLEELGAYLAWNASAGPRAHKNLKRGFRNWLAEAARRTKR